MRSQHDPLHQDPSGSRGFRMVDLYPFGGIIGIVTYILIECL
jgi:hypothetical protein